MTDNVEDELHKLRERIAEQVRQSERGDDSDDVKAVQDGARVGFIPPDEDDE